MEDENLPKIIQEAGFDFWWDIKKVWALDYPIEEMNVLELEVVKVRKIPIAEITNI